MSTEATTLAAALARFQSGLTLLKPAHQAEIPTKGGLIRYAYAEMADVIEHVRPGLAENGLSFTQACCYLDGHLVVRMRLLHTSGEDDVGYMPIEHSGNDMRALGSAMTYAKRYLAVSMLGIAVGGEDDDGQRAEKTRQSRQESDWSRQAKAKARATAEVAACTDAAELMEWWESNKEGISELNPDTVSDIKALVSQRHKAFGEDPQPKSKETLKDKTETTAAPSDTPTAADKPKTTTKPVTAHKEATPPPPADDDFAGMFDK